MSFISTASIGTPQPSSSRLADQGYERRHITEQRVDEPVPAGAAPSISARRESTAPRPVTNRRVG
jgi:hypothetical protein